MTLTMSGRGALWRNSIVWIRIPFRIPIPFWIPIIRRAFIGNTFWGELSPESRVPCQRHARGVSERDITSGTDGMVEDVMG